MWQLLILSLLTGEAELVERGFASLQHCKARLAQWEKTNINSDHYRLLCIKLDEETNHIEIPAHGV